MNELLNLFLTLGELVISGLQKLFNGALDKIFLQILYRLEPIDARPILASGEQAEYNG